MAQDIHPHSELTDEATHVASPVAHSSQEPIVAQTSLLRQFGQFLLFCVILAVGFAVFVAAAMSKKEPRKEAREAGLPTVRTVKISPHDSGMTIDVDGTVVPFREITLTTEVAGRVRSKAPECRAGNFVKEGTLLFEIDPLDYDLEARRLTQEVRQAEINVKSIKIDIENNLRLVKLGEKDLELQKREVARLEKLLPQGVATQSDVDRAKRTELASENALETLKNQGRALVSKEAAQNAQLDLASTRLEKAQVDLNRTKILAPIDGVITNELVEVDSFVQRGATLIQIEDTSAVEVMCNLKADQIYWLWEQAGKSESTANNYDLPRAPVRVVCSLAGRAYEWNGVLDRYDGMGLNARTRTVPCRILVSNPRGGRPVQSDSMVNAPALVRGMYVRTQIQVDSASAKFASIPMSGLKPGNEIWRVVDGKLRRSKVKVARMMDDLALLENDSSSFSVGDAVIISPLPNPVEGMDLDTRTDVEVAKAAKATSSEDSEQPKVPSEKEASGSSSESNDTANESTKPSEPVGN
ncbi:MAG: HlyD family efflux transporter periplasmic adaptor subunit [Planctomycetota bacterium]